MNTIHNSCKFYGIQYKNHHNTKQNDSVSKMKLHDNKPKLSKVSTDNMKANYLVNFKGGMKFEKSDNSGIGTVNHQTAFFREPKTDEIVQNYILKEFDSDDEINIVSGACSTGEEAKSYAMMLDSIKDKLNIYGFDISEKIVEEANNEDCQLIRADSGFSKDIDSENFLLDENTDSLSSYQKKCYDKFRQYYTPKGSEYGIPVFPDAKKELKNIEHLLNNPEALEKQKKQYNEQMQMLKSTFPDVAEYMENVTFEDAMEMSKRTLESQAKVYRTVRDFSTDMSRFKNCSFDKGDIMNLDSLYEPNSVNVLLYRNALYHTLCMGDNMFRYMKEDAKDTMNAIAMQMNKIIKPRGLVVFGEKEWMQGIDNNIISETMKNNGFAPLQDDYTNNIWVKVKDI